MKDVMIDLETMSTDKRAAILSIGAVSFNIEELRITDEFYQNIELSSCIHLGLHKSQATLDWWAKDENKSARDALTKDAVRIEDGVTRFLKWADGEIIPWGNGASFDIPILEFAIKACSRPVPWKFYNESCFRTLKRLYGRTVLAPKFEGIKHNALDDARAQAMHLMKILHAITINEGSPSC